MKIVSFSLEQGNRYYGAIDGQRFFIGRRVSYGPRKGLMNVEGSEAQRYQRAAYRHAYGFWADFIHPSAMAEGALFHTLNTYDRAAFTFSFLQFAAHVPDGDFVRYLRGLLALPLALEYFPDLKLEGGRICRLTNDGFRALESATSTQALMDYLNPSTASVEDTEVINAAKLIHWALNDPLHQQLQIAQAVANIRTAMANYATRYRLDGVNDVVCLMVADIRHQGRANSPEIVAALGAADPLEALLKIGDITYASRLRTLRHEIRALTDDGTLGRRRYSMADREFI